MAERFIALDTETTGIEPADRIIEIAAVEVIDRRVTGAEIAHRINPEGRAITYESYQIHRIDDAAVASAPLFQEVWPQFVDFIGSDPIVIHNKAFDLGYLVPAIERAGLAPLSNNVIDSIELARELWPGQSPSLNAILRRLGLFDQERAKKHGGLIDSRLLAEAWVRMLTLREQPRVQSELVLTSAPQQLAASPVATAPRRPIKAI